MNNTLKELIPICKTMKDVLERLANEMNFTVNRAEDIYELGKEISKVIEERKILLEFAENVGEELGISCLDDMLVVLSSP